MDQRQLSESVSDGHSLISPRPRRGSAATGALALVVFAVAVSAAGCGGSTSFAAQATSICTSAQSSLKVLHISPASIAAALEAEHSALDIYTREVGQLNALQPPQSIASQFRAGVADNETLVGLLGSMLQRPDFVQLSLTLPHHPELMPAWLKAWLARSQTL